MDQKTPPEVVTRGDSQRDMGAIETIVPLPGQEMPPPKRTRFTLSPINLRRWRNFKANKRGYWSLWIFLVLFVVTLFAELIANDRPLVVSYKGETLFPIFVDYPEVKFGGFLATTDYRDPIIEDEILANGWMLWPPIRYSYGTVNNEIPTPIGRPTIAILQAHGIRPWRRSTRPTSGS